MTLPFAPELKFIKAVKDTNYYQFDFSWAHKMQFPGMPVIMQEHRPYLLTVAEKGDTFVAHIKDSAGLDYASREFPRAEFETNWKKFMELMKQHE